MADDSKMIRYLEVSTSALIAMGDLAGKCGEEGHKKMWLRLYASIGEKDVADSIADVISMYFKRLDDFDIGGVIAGRISEIEKGLAEGNVTMLIETGGKSKPSIGNAVSRALQATGDEDE